MSGETSKGRNWVNTLFFFITPVAAVVVTIFYLRAGPVPMSTWLLMAFFMLACPLSITAGYHRLFSHRTYQARWPVRLFFVLFGGACFQGSVIWWSKEHRVHHRYEDTDQDPYGIQKGFWYAHLGWLLEKREEASDRNVPDLISDRMLVIQNRYYLPLAIGVGFLLPAAIAALWGDWWGGFIFAGLVRMVIVHHSTFCINSVCHFFGKKTYSHQLTARDSWMAALLTYGEGYHNFHHMFEGDYRNGIRAYHWDPTKWLIRTLNGLGFAKNLHRISAKRILAARLKNEERFLMDALSRYSDRAHEQALALMLSSKRQLQQTHTRWLQLKAEYQALKHQQQISMKSRLKQLKEDVRQARREFQQARETWCQLLKETTYTSKITVPST